MSFSAIIYGLVIFMKIINDVQGIQTALAIIQNFTGIQKIAIQPKSFQQLVAQSEVFLDKTLFIKDIMQSLEVALINCPQTWGKSINLDMLRYFLRIDVDENGIVTPVEQSAAFELFKNGIIIHRNKMQKLISPLLITNETKFLDKYLGKHPVIYVDFSGIEVQNFEQYIFHIKSRISIAYREHIYLRNELKRKTNQTKIGRHNMMVEDDVTIFTDNLNARQSKSQTIASLQFLSRLLNSRYNNTVILLMDGYDSVFHKLFFIRSIKHVGDIFEFFNSLIETSFQNNVFLEKGILSGILDLTHVFNGFKRTETYKFFDDKLYQYFGLNEPEMNMLSNHLAISKGIREQIDMWYDGYRASEKSKLRVYNTLSVVQFLWKKQNMSYWMENRFMDDVFRQIFKVDNYRNIFHSLITGEDCPIILKSLRFKLGDFQQWPDSATRIKEENINFMFRYLFATGYLSFRDNFSKQIDLRNPIHLRVPNKGISKTLKRKLISYYETKLGIRTKNIRQNVDSFSENFIEFLDSNDRTSEKLVNSLELLLNEFPPFENFGTTSTSSANKTRKDKRKMNTLRMNTETLNSIMAYLTLFSDSYKKLTVPQMILQKKQRFVIIEIASETQSMKENLEQAKQCKTLLAQHKFKKTVKFIGINIFSNKTVHVNAILHGI